MRGRLRTLTTLNPFSRADGGSVHLTVPSFLSTLRSMEVHFSPDLETKVNRVAAENRSGADEYVQQLVEHYIDHDAWFRQRSGRDWSNSTGANI
jgi:hypothetical protein